MRRYLAFATFLLVQVASALLPALRMTPHILRLHLNPRLVAASAATTLGERQLSFYEVVHAKTALLSSITGDEMIAENSSTNASSRASTIYSHLQSASLAQSQSDASTQQQEVESAERALVQWVEQYRGRSSERMEDDLEPPDAQIFSDVIAGLLALPSSLESPSNGDGSDSMKDISGDGGEVNDQIRKAILGKGKSSVHKIQSEDTRTRSDRVTHMLDLMENFHEPTGALYDTIIASNGADALDHLSHLTMDENIKVGKEEEEEGVKSKSTPHYQEAQKSAKRALQLLNRSEELYRETRQSSSRLPSISSYVTLMDVWKALAVSAEVDDKKRKDEALDVVKNLRDRRLQVYTLDSDAAKAGREKAGGYNILPTKVSSMAVDKVLDFAVNLLHESVPSYQLIIEDPTKVGTWHFNQLIFDLAKYPQTFSGPLAQDLLEYMMSVVRKSSPKHRRRSRNKDIFMTHSTVPKPNVMTINSVLKAWKVTNVPDVARRAEAVLAKLAVWQSEGVLWGVSADTVSYNTVMSCWKESVIRGAAQRATEILCLMEDETTNVYPDVISYASAIGAWADCASHEPNAARNAEEILMRMYNRNLEANGDESVAPKPTSRCFNAVLLAYANGRRRGGGKSALDLLRFMEKLNSDGYSDLSPDTFSFNTVMKALATCGENGASRKANQLLERMEESYSKGDTCLKPDLLSYNTVLDAYSKEGDAKSAERFLERMLSDDSVNPDSHSYTAVLSALSRSEDKIEAVRRAEALFDDIEGRYAAGLTDFRADTAVYNALINCWAKSGERKALYRVTQLLSLMEELGFKGGDSAVQPNARTYCAVLDCLANSKSYKAYGKSFEVLQRMKDFYLEGYEQVRPNTRAYSIVLSTIARSRRKFKAQKAQELLHRMEEEYRGGNSACRPNVYSYNAVLNAAAFSGKDEREQEEAFKVACLTFDELRMSDYLQPSHVSYGTFLKAIKKFMPESEVRDNLVKGLFRKCCRDGLVSDFVLKETAHLSSPDLYQSLLKGVTNDYGNLPKSWSANVR